MLMNNKHHKPLTTKNKNNSIKLKIKPQNFVGSRQTHSKIYGKKMMFLYQKTQTYISNFLFRFVVFFKAREMYINCKIKYVVVIVLICSKLKLGYQLFSVS